MLCTSTFTNWMKKQTTFTSTEGKKGQNFRPFKSQVLVFPGCSHLDRNNCLQPIQSHNQPTIHCWCTWVKKNIEQLIYLWLNNDHINAAAPPWLPSGITETNGEPPALISPNSWRRVQTHTAPFSSINMTLLGLNNMFASEVQLSIAK